MIIASRDAMKIGTAVLRLGAGVSGLTIDVWETMPADARDSIFSQYTRAQPIARAGLLEEIAEAYLYLFRGGHTTRLVLRVDGGGLVG